MATEQTYVLDGPTEFFFPFPVRTDGQVVVSLIPGGVLPQSEYTVIGASATANGVTIRYPNAPRDGSVELSVVRRTEPNRVSTFLDDLSITATGLNAEFDNILQIVQDGILSTYSGDWETAVGYAELEVVTYEPEGNVYICREAHTSDDFDTDLADGKWDLVADFEQGQANIDIARNEAEQFRDEAESSAAAALQSEQNAAPVNAIVSEIQTVAAIDSSVDVVASDLAGAGFDYDLGEITQPTQGVVGTPDGYIITVFNIRDEIIAVADNETNINTVANVDANVTTVASISSDVTTVAGISADVTNVVGNSADISTVAGISADVTSVSGISADVSTVAGIDTNVTTVAGIDTDVTAVSGISADVTTAADNIVAIQNAPQAATDAADARDKAEQWAQEAEDVEVEPGEFSAFHWAQKAEAAAQGDADAIFYDNATSGLSASNVQAAIDEVVNETAALDGNNTFTGNQTVTGDVTITGTLDCGSIA